MSQTTTSPPDFDARYRAVASRDARFDGRFFTAVTSTGIYCRPICPARTPARRNVLFFDDAAAAETAGFRPCKRCRPEASPGSPAWDVRKDLVGRALRLIDDGVADELGVRGLAERLHVTERHLHRLFVTEVGAAPVAVARTRRLQLARRLLAETGMPVTDVAFASGFGSVRQFNATVRAAYGQTPSELRNGKRLAAGLELRLAYRPPYAADALLGFLRPRAVPGVEAVSAEAYSRAVPGGVITLTPRAGHVLLRASMDDVRGAARLVVRARRLFDLDADPASVAEVLAADPALRPLVAARPGLRVPGAFDAFELAVRAVLGQQVSVAAARTLAGRLVTTCGTPLPGDRHEAGLTHLFPAAESVADADLSNVGLPASRRRTLRALAAAVASGDLDLGGGADPAETSERLLALPGVGPWTAAYIAMRALGDPDALPADDLVIRRAMERLGVRDGGRRWRPWRAYAAMHLWAFAARNDDTKRKPGGREGTQ